MVRSKLEAAVQQQIVFLRLTQRKPGAQRTKRRMIYGLLAKQTPTEAREHPQLPHWDASWAHLQRILGASSANLGRIFSETWTPRRFCSGRLMHCMNCRTSTHTGALGTEKETRHKSHAMGECLKHLARKQKQMGVKSAKTICMLSIGDSPSDQRPGPKERKATTAAILAQGTRHTYTARFRMCSHGRSKTDSRSPKDPKCPVIRLGIPKPTSGHQQVTRSRCPEVGLGNLDSTSERSQKVESRKRNPTSGHQERPAKAARRRREVASGGPEIDQKRSSGSLPGRDGPGGAKRQVRAGSKSLLVSYSKVVDLEPFRPPAGPGPIRAVFGPPRTRTSRRPERRTGTRVQRDDPSFKVHDDEHDDELDDDDDDDATTSRSRQKIRGVQKSK